MSGLLFLTSDDFGIGKGEKGNILCHAIQGFSLVLFYSTQCEHCQELIPIFKKLPGTLGGCQFGIINVSSNKKCIMMAKETVVPITYVPYIILYIDGKPYMAYDGPHDANEIKRFVLEVSKSVSAKQQFSSENVKKDRRGGGIPAYCIGQPLKGNAHISDKVCYLNFDDAYGK